MILYSGTHTLRRDAEPLRPLVIDWASVSSATPSRVTVTHENGQIIDDVHIGPYSPHTWWSSNGLLSGIELQPGEAIIIGIANGAIMRIETNLVAQ